MNHPTSTLMLLLAIQHALYGGAWWLGAWRLSLSRSAAMHWVGFCLLSSLALLLFVSPWSLPDAVTVPLRNLSLVTACMLMRRGLANFVRQPLADREQLTLWLLVALSHAWLGSGPDSLLSRSLLMSSVLAWLLLRLCGEQWAATHREFGRATAVMLALPPGVIGLAFAVRALMMLGNGMTPVESHIATPTPSNALLLFAVVVMSTVFQFTLLFMVIQRLVAKLRHLSRHDPLTGLLNRRAWNQALAQQRLQLRRRPRPLGLLMVDIDHFKLLNDRLGHAAGDAALSAVAATLQSVARATDVVARLGGEEFGMLLIDTDVQGAALAAERVRAAVARLPFTHEDRELPMTVSVGASVLAAEVASRTDAEALVALADDALYQAKAAGRNRVVVLTAPGDALIRAV